MISEGHGEESWGPGRIMTKTWEAFGSPVFGKGGYFGAGAMLASFVWFFSLSLGGKMIAPLFSKALSWRILDTLVGLTMWTIAFSVVHGLIAAQEFSH